MLAVVGGGHVERLLGEPGHSVADADAAGRRGEGLGPNDRVPLLLLGGVPIVLDNVRAAVGTGRGRQCDGVASGVVPEPNGLQGILLFSGVREGGEDMR